MPADLTTARTEIGNGQRSACSFMEACMAAAGSDGNRHAFTHTSFETALAAAVAADVAHAAGRPPLPLGGLAVSVKDLFDVEGQVTCAGSIVLEGREAATADCLAVARLRSAGAGLLARSNMSEFAFSGVGINPHHGTPANPATAALDPMPRIPGGSTSGGGVSVASGAAFATLGSDTGGSIRIPAALQGLVGFKNTARLTPAEGAIPLSTTLDTVCAITRSVRDAVLVHEVLAHRRVPLGGRPVRGMRLAVPTTVMLEGLDSHVARAFDRSLAALRRAGAHVLELPLAALGELDALNARGSFAAAESWAWHRQLLSEHRAQYDPRVAARIRRGESMTAADYIDLIQSRKRWIARMEASMAGFDAMLSPTVPIVAPPIAPLISNDDAFFAVNALLLRNPSAVNMLDGCALSLPCHAPGEFPVGLMAWSSAMRDDALLEVSMAIEDALATAGR